KLPKDSIATKTTAETLAAGPLTLVPDLLIKPMTSPPITPEIKPEISGAPLAKAIPKQSGKATKKTTIPDGISLSNRENMGRCASSKLARSTRPLRLGSFFNSYDLVTDSGMKFSVKYHFFPNCQILKIWVEVKYFGNGLE